MNENINESVKSPSQTSIYNKVGFFKILAATFAVSLSVLGGVCFALHFDVQSMYLANSPLVYSMYALIAVIALVILILSFVSKEKILPCQAKSGAITGVISCIPLLFMIAPSITQDDFIKNLLIVLSLFLAMIYFSGCTRMLTSQISVHTLLGLAAIAWCVVIIALTYFDYSAAKIAVNSHYEVLCQFGIAFAMLFIVSELRYDLGSSRAWMYKACGCLSLCINLLAGVASVILIIKGRKDILIYASPAVAMAIYSTKIFLISNSPSAQAESQEESNGTSAEVKDTDGEEQAQERTQTDENIN